MVPEGRRFKLDADSGIIKKNCLFLLTHDTKTELFYLLLISFVRFIFVYYHTNICSSYQLPLLVKERKPRYSHLFLFLFLFLVYSSRVTPSRVIRHVAFIGQGDTIIRQGNDRQKFQKSVKRQSKGKSIVKLKLKLGVVRQW